MKSDRNGHMTAAVLYGSEDLKIERVGIPTMADDEVLVRVKVALTCGTDLKVWKQGYHARMITPPAIFGHELAGVVEAVGRNVNGGLHRGMRVVPANSAPCNICIFCRRGRENLCEDLLFNNGAYASYDVSKVEDPIPLVRQLTEGNRGADSVIEAVGLPRTWEWAIQMVRRGGTVNLFGGCPRGSKVEFDPTALHYSEITIKSTFHHTPRFIREALDAVARGEVRAVDFITGEIPLQELPGLFEHMKHRNGEQKTAVIP